MDILPRFIEEGQELLKQHGVEEKGKIVIGDMTKLSDVVGGQTFTHVLTLGCLFYIHDSMDAFLEQLRGFCDPGAWVVNQDFSRTVPVDKVLAKCHFI